MSCEELIVDAVNDTFAERTCAQEQAVVERSAQEIDCSVDINVASERAFRNCRPHDLTNTFTAWIEPALPKCDRKLRIGLSLRYKGTDEGTSGTPKEGRLQVKLLPKAFDGAACFREIGPFSCKIIRTRRNFSRL